MKICYINPTMIVRRPIAELIELMGNEHEVGILIPRKPFSSIDTTYHGTDKLGKAKIYSYAAINLPLKYEWPIPITPLFFIQLIRIFSRYDLVHMWTYSYLSNCWAALLRPFSKTKLIMSADTLPAYSFNMGAMLNSAYRIHNWTIGRFIYSMCDAITLYGDSLMTHARHMRMPTKKISIIPTGVHIDKFAKAKKINLHKEFSLHKKRKVILSIGIIAPRKGVDTAMETAQRLPEHEFLWAGTGPYLRRYKKILAKEGIANFRFIGARKDIPQLLKSADIFFLPSRAEGLPGVIMEAMAAGLPVVSSNIPCIPDLIDPRLKTLCTPADTGAYTKSIAHLLANKKYHAKVVSAQSRRIKELSWQHIKQHYDEVYRCAA